MDHKTWLWRKKSSEKTIVTTDKPISLETIDEEVQIPSMDGGRDRLVKNLNEKLASVLLEGHAKDDLLTKNVKMAPEANSGCLKAEAEAVFLKKELEEALRQGKLANEKLTQSDAALKDCMQQLNFVREEQEQRIRDAIKKTSDEFEKAQKALQEKLTEANRKLEELASDNSRLSKALLVKEKLIEDQQKHKSQAEAEFSALMTRLDITEKENAFLKYEYHVLEKELEIRNDEMEFNRRSADLAHKQHLDGVKKIAKLEAECQKLRLLLQKRLPGPAAVVKMKNQVEMLGRDKTDMRRKKLNPTRDMIIRDSTAENPAKNINFLLEQLHNMEEENRSLKEMMSKKNTEFQSSSRPTQVEFRPRELFKVQNSTELVRSSPVSSELSLTSAFDIGSIDGFSSSSSWANALISESAHSRDRRLGNPMEHKAIAVPEMRLMDDFVEMEKLALVAGGGNNQLSVAAERERSFDWLQVVLHAITEHKRMSNRSSHEVLEDIRIALGCSNLLSAPGISKRASSMDPIEADSLRISGYLGWKSPTASPTVGSLSGASSSVGTPAEKKQPLQSNLSNSICRIIELIEGLERDQSPNQLTAHADYFVRVFQWKSSELSTVLQRVLRTCNDLLSGRADLEIFAEELSFALDWIVNDCVTPKEASIARDKIKRHFGWNESKSEKEFGSQDEIHVSEEQSSCLDSFASSDDQNKRVVSQKEGIQCSLEEENKRLKDDLKNMEARLESATDKTEALTVQLHEAEETIGSLETELKILKESKEMIEDQVENQKSINEDLDTQLTVAKVKVNELFQKCSSLEVELEYKNNCCEELEATCLELQLQLESVAKKETPKYVMNQEGKQSQKGWEITAASVKLAECQETILNLGKQLKVLASPQEAALFDKVFSNNAAGTAVINNRRISKRFSLRDRMIAEDGAKAEASKSPNAESENSSLPDSKNEGSNTAVMALAIVPSKKQGVGLLRRLLLRRKKGYSKKSRN
ncbi:hypothetical protein COLO4_32628 [Corchorus olitorius]|uniref:Filament-like plant protein 7 n=1 Tax=Corchorus olitorius TaxID=93759 RepID=A0A1R3GYS6_9ROSI|nr:hypothetical protein COLO4_32628 [Corchorus olitorius]